MCALLALNAIELSFCLESAPASPSTACDTRGDTTLPAQVLLRQRRGETPGAALRRENTQRLPVPGRPPVGRRDRRRRRPRRRHIEPEGPRAARVAAAPFRAPRLGAPRRPRAEQTRMPLRRASIILTIRRGVRGGAAEWLAPGRRRRRRGRREACRGAGAEVRAGGRIPPRCFGRPRRRRLTSPRFHQLVVDPWGLARWPGSGASKRRAGAAADQGCPAPRSRRCCCCDWQPCRRTWWGWRKMRALTRARTQRWEGPRRLWRQDTKDSGLKLREGGSRGFIRSASKRTALEQTAGDVS